MFSVSVLPRSMRLGSVIAAAADTSTVVVVPATLTVMSTVAVAPALNAMPVRRGFPRFRGLLEAGVGISDLDCRARNGCAGWVRYRPRDLSVDGRRLPE